MIEKIIGKWIEKNRYRSGVYLSNGTERLGSRNKPESVPIAFAGPFDLSTVKSGFSRSAICLFTRSISTTSFFDS